MHREPRDTGLGDGAPFDFSPAGGPRARAPRGGVLCIHGFTGTPFEMRYLGQRLSARGLAAVGPALAGHGETPAALDATTWQDWYQSVEAAFDDLRRRVGPVAVVGQSLGGLLALYLAANRGAELAAVCSLAAPTWLPGPTRAAIRATRPPARLARWTRWLRSVPKLGGPDVRDPIMKRQNPCYRVFPVRAVHQLADFMAVVDRALPRVRVPTLVLHGRHDHTAPPACAAHIAATVGTSDVRARTLERSYHLVAIDVERDTVAAEVGDFIEARLRAASAAGPGARANQEPSPR